ncbi:MAG: competence/damage-inducible protein A [Burkholderiaceae bacterium]|nr:competence/damage-inducible protein A [Burkholderiaceae bacterium]
MTVEATEPSLVTAAVLIIGNEILSGRTQDTNLAYLARKLNEYGIQIRQARVVPDIERDIVEAVNALRDRHDYVFTTGGIGPTHDDITADSIAAAFGVDLVVSPEIAALLERRPAPPEIMASRMRMARIPRGAGLIANPLGPPGFHLGNVYVMAGIPRVMQQMIDSLAGKLRRGATMRSRSVTAFLPESQVARRLGQIQQELPQVDIGSYPFQRDNRYGTTLVMRGSDDAALDAALGAVSRMIVELGGEPLDVQAG